MSRASDGVWPEDSETVTQEVTQDADGEDEEVGVGPLGWLGFAIMNFAAWGIITTGHSIASTLGFVICLAYTLALVGVAVCVERRDKTKYHQFVNLLWVLVATFILVLGVYFSVQVFGPHHAPGNGGNSNFGKDTLGELLPETAGTEVRHWLEDDDWQPEPKPSYISFGSSLYFRGKDNSSQEVLLRIEGATVTRVRPTLSEVYLQNNYALLNSSILFTAKNETEYSESIYRIDEDDPDVAQWTISPRDVMDMGADFSDMFPDQQSSTLYIRGSYYCHGCGVSVETLLSSDGTTSGTKDLRGDVCTDACKDNSDEYVEWGNEEITATMWGGLLLGVLPMMVVAGIVLALKKLGALILNLLVGVMLMVYVLWGLSLEGRRPSDLEFYMWFLMFYASLLYSALFAWSLTHSSLPKWQEELKAWATDFTAVLFVFILHDRLSIPYDDAAWRWVVFGGATFLQMLLAAVISRPPPMICAAGGLFELAGYYSYQLVNLVPWPSEQIQMIATLLIFALAGMFIIAAAMYYAGNRVKIERFVRALLSFDRETTQRAKQQLLGE